MDRNKEIMLIENMHQAAEYLEEKEKFKKILPISFSLEAEEILSKNNIKFKTEEYYEKEDLHKRVHKECMLILENLEKTFRLSYRGVEILPLFHVELYQFLAIKKRYVNILGEIIKKEKPGKIYVFRNENAKGLTADIYSDIVEDNFQGKIGFLNYRLVNEEKRKGAGLIEKIGERLQDIMGRLNIFLAGKDSRVILLSGTKGLFESTLKELLKERKNRVIRCSNTLQKSFFVDRKYVPFYQFKGKATNNRMYIDGLKEGVDRLSQQIKDSSFQKEISKSIKNKLSEIINSRFQEVAGWINEIAYLAEKGRIKLIILHADVDLFQRTLVETAKLYGIPSIVSQHGVCGHPIGFVPVSSDYILTWGEGSKKRLLKWGCPKEKIILTGPPQYDVFMNEKDTENGTEEKAGKTILYAVNSSDPVKTLPGHPTKKRQKEILRILFDAARKFPDHKLIVKTKPGWELTGLAEKVAKEKEFSNAEIINGKADNKRLMQNADVMIIMSTAMGMESLILGKPLVSVFFKDLEDYTPYDKKKVTTVYNAKQLETAIRKSLMQSEKDILKNRKFLEQEFYRLDGKASERAVNFINNLLSRS